MERHRRSSIKLPHSICMAVPPEEACVQPKTRTPQVGVTLRTMSHNLALLPPHGTFATTWITLPTAIEKRQAINRSGEEPFNLLIVPYPFGVSGFCFREDAQPGGMEPRFFECEQKWLRGRAAGSPVGTELGKSLLRLIREAKKGVSRVHGIVMPELAVDETRAKALVRQLKKADVELFVSGVLKRGRGSKDFSANVAWAVPFWKGGVPFIAEQPKHNRWRLDHSQIIRYSLGHVLNPKDTFWERIDVSRRNAQFFVFRNGVSFTSIICEDLARVDPAGAVIRAIGPNLVVALLMDGPQLESRWPAKYASVLSEDPGSAVLTVTSLGMVKRSMAPGASGDRVVALWQEPGERAKQINLPRNAHALLLTLSFSTLTERTFDGRDDGGGSTRIRLSGLRAVVDPKLDSEDRDVV